MFDKNDLISWFQGKGLAERTIEEYLYYLDKANFQHIPTQQQLDRFLAEHTYNQVCRAAIKNLFEYIKVSTDTFTEAQRALVSPLIIGKRTGRQQKKESRYATPQQVTKLISAVNGGITGMKMALMTKITFEAGLRSSEILSITPYHFLWKEWQTKGGPLEGYVISKKKRRAIFLPEHTARELVDYIERTGAGKEGGAIFKIGARCWRKNLQRLSRKALGKELNPHALRHGFATYMVKKNVNIKLVQEYLGHSSLATTQRYAHIGVDELRKHQEELHNERVNRLNQERKAASVLQG